MDFGAFKERVAGKSPGELVHEFRHGLLVVAVFLFSLWIRLIPRDGMRYMQALDPYMISRMAEAIVTSGNLPLIDVWRYFPYTTATSMLSKGNIVIPALLYHLVSPFMSFQAWTQVYPALAGALMVLAMYFVGKEMFDGRAGLLAAFFLAASPAVLHRSSAGWFEKEPFAGFLMITSIYFVTRAWKRTDWLSGIAAGAALGISSTVWGGTQFLYLLYPLALFLVALVEEDAEALVAAFTPTLLVGHILPVMLGQSNFITQFQLAGIGILVPLWIRYAVEEYDLVDRAYQGYTLPVTYVVGAIFLFLSPLYSQLIARKVQGLIKKATQQTGVGTGAGVVGGTVAENMPASGGQIIGQLGAVRARAVFKFLGPATEFVSGWTFALIGTTVLMMVLSYMVWDRYGDPGDLSARATYALFFPAFFAITGALFFALPGNNVGAFLFAFAVAVVGIGALSAFPPEDGLSVERRWYLLIPFLWVISTLYGATQRSRLMFLTAQPVALMAGYGLSVGIGELRRSRLWEEITQGVENVDAKRVYTVVLALVIVPVLAINGAAAYGMAQGIGGSPNQAWMQNLDYMRENTPPDSVILSWWDYGYWFQTIGGRASIADGGNLGFYRVPGKNYNATPWKINFPLADFLTAENYTNHLDWVQSLSVDYVVLDASMIGKYSAVSQIHHRNNQEFNAMQTASCRTQNNRCVTTQANNRTYFLYQSQGVRFLVPFTVVDGQPVFNGPPLAQTNRGTAAVSNLCTENGVQEVDVPANRSALPGCVAFHPNKQHRTLVYIPQEVMRSTLVELYIMDAPDMPHFTEVFDNGYVKMWKVDYTPNQ